MQLLIEFAHGEGALTSIAAGNAIVAMILAEGLTGGLARQEEMDQASSIRQVLETVRRVPHLVLQKRL